MMDKNYDHAKIEEGKFDKWKEEKRFAASCDTADVRPTFSMIIPPPNVTGVLHIGHALDSVIPDILARYKKLHGYDVSFVPGTDHAGIATQAKVERILKQDNISRYDLGRQKFIEKVWDYKNKSQETIHRQWKALGIGMDYDREAFTMDENTTRAVRKVFKSLYDEGLIYQGERIINWDIELQTALSNIEVEHKDIPGKFYYFKYVLSDDPSKSFTIATTRPETMFADVCVVFNPKDKRYAGLEGKYVINPANGEKLPLIADYYVDIEFGTGLMKCTPAHDPNDFNIAKRHNLDMPVCMTKQGKMNALAGEFEGMDRYECREKLVEKIASEGNVVKIEDIIHSVGHSSRSNTIVEPTLSKQWFVSIKPMAEAVLKLQKNENTKIHFFPERFEKIFIQWLENAEDWCISRQLWWGHRIPIFTNKKTGEVVCSEKDLDESEWEQDPDVLDTWFSSGLSPLVLCGWPNEDSVTFKKYYPLDLMVTGYDIIFFWVARMAFDSVHFSKKMPFKNVFIHGLVRDDKGRKMSKSLGNGIDPIAVIDKYGVDSLRYALATTVTPGLDMSFGDEKIKSSHIFLNKVWNASRFVIMNFPNEFVPKPVSELKLNFVDQYLYKNFDETIENLTVNIEKYELGQGANYLYNFIYNVFCSNYIEEVKVDLNGSDQERRETVLSILYDVLKKVLVVLFPYAPFITEEIYSYLPVNKGSIYNEEYPIPLGASYTDADTGKQLVEMVKFVRKYKVDNKLAPNYAVELAIKSDPETAANLKPYLEKLTYADEYKVVDSADKSFRFFSDIGLSVTSKESKEAIMRIKARIKTLKNELIRSEKILSNPNFLAKAPKEKIAEEKEKQAKYQTELEQYAKYN
ncbi:MAG: valine--tRNA ligase [Bacilli bacterium]